VDFAVLVLLIDAFALAFFRGSLPPAFLGVFLAIGALGLTLVVALFMAPRLRWNLGSRLPWLASGPLGRFQEGFVQAPGNLPLLFGITAGLWLFESARLYLVLHALPLQALSLTQVSLVALVGSALTAVPGLPGGVALVEGGIIAVLIYFGMSAAAALSVALLDRAINYWSVLLLGVIILVAGRLLGRVSQPLAQGLSGAEGQRPAPSSRDIPRAASITAGTIPLAGPRGTIRSLSPTTPIAPAASPVWSKMGAATLDSPRTASSCSTATPAARIWASSFRKVAAVGVCLVSFGRVSEISSSTTESEEKARMALPRALA
jgi:hypothetical protein